MKPQQPTIRKWMRRGVIAGLVIVLLLIGGEIINATSSNQKTAQRKPTIRPPVPSVVIPPVVAAPSVPPASTDTVAPTPKETPSTPSGKSTIQTSTDAPASSNMVLTYAVTALYELSADTFAPAARVQADVSKLAVPTLQTDLAKQIVAFGPRFAKMLGYSNIAEAAASAAYETQPQMYRFEKLSNNEATIALFMVTQWVSADGELEMVPYITLVHMQASGNTWLYAGTSEPPPNQQPPKEVGLTYDQTVARIQPYLKGFKYVQTE